MSRVNAWGIRCLATIVALASAANAQPVPRQVLVARTVLIGNGGSESYGAESYYRLTKYDGGPDRPYRAFYTAMQSWGHYELVGSTTDADLLLVIKFTNPVVDRAQQSSTETPPDWIYDPQLDLSINDPRTGLPLWTITEHIEPGGDRAVANKRYDDAVTRLVGDLKRIILNPDSIVSPESIALPPGALAAAERRRREIHSGIGALLGGTAASILAATTFNRCDDVQACATHGASHAAKGALGFLSGVALGAAIGWYLPVHIQ
jgi:hypothetical protein